MARFHLFLPILLRFEGGYVNHPADPGGATNKGITLRTFQTCAKQLLDVDPTLENLTRLTDSQAGTIYKALYWDRVRGDDIDSQPLAEIVVDFQVNAGAESARLLQRVLNDLGAQPPLTVDGGVGALTLAALRRADATAVYRRFRQGRIAYYEDLAARRPDLQCFLRGWLNRVAEFPEL